MAQLATGNGPEQKHGFAGLCRTLIDFQPLILAVNGLGLGFERRSSASPTLFASTNARFKCPFTALGVAPELSSSMTFPASSAVRNASWAR